MRDEIRQKAIDSTKILLQAEIKRILELLRNDLGIGFKYDTYKIKAELKNKMTEARRDMIRLEKLMRGTCFLRDREAIE